MFYTTFLTLAALLLHAVCGTVAENVSESRLSPVEKRGGLETLPFPMFYSPLFTIPSTLLLTIRGNRYAIYVFPHDHHFCNLFRDCSLCSDPIR